MVSLSERLSAVAALVREGTSLADVGCDHGFLPVFLLQSGKIRSAVASDINEGPLRSCRELVEREGLSEEIICVLSNGLDNISADDADDIAICGMGGELIVKLLSACPYARKENKHFIFNPMTHPEILRRYLCENGFEIQNDLIVKEGRHYYNVFDCFFTGEINEHNEEFYYLGKIMDFSCKPYFEHLLRYLENKEKGGSDLKAVIKAIKQKTTETDSLK